MKISTLQSLIDRTSNQIADYEYAVNEYKKFIKNPENDFCLEQSLYALKYCKAKLPKLREMQKELKREIAANIFFCSLAGLLR